ncbi:large conductance mechanosensitive channel protein MscL [Evansella sp. AB-P1]|uniref:large conductance mechanosensitive channel protein MscL n=1 Tax=Evansella sp. AB-P1 TaxID=3037653 RepID=UPI00241FAC42|nr:large conductance mechanosensitive channel protein MscL [Evansella sp. AB-P1]MDG5787450.1 large conductance mechanosensitive channel protein MscL [Evansella sp. AB-P1]
MTFFKGFKEFAVRGNVVDMGIGVIIGAAFGKIVNSFVSDVLMPPLGLFLGKVNFSNLYVNLSGGNYNTLSEAEEAGAATINYGLFLESIIHFVIIAFAAYLIIIQMNKLRRVSMESTRTKTCPYCYSDIPSRALRCPKCTSGIDEKRQNTRPEKIVRIR